MVALGGGRQRPSDAIDHAVGLAEVKGIGEPVGAERPFAIVHARDQASAAAAAARLIAAVEVIASPPPEAPVLIGRIGAPEV